MEDHLMIIISSAIDKSNKLNEEYYRINEERAELYDKMLSLQSRVCDFCEKVRQQKQ